VCVDLCKCTECHFGKEVPSCQVGSSIRQEIDEQEKEILTHYQCGCGDLSTVLGFASVISVVVSLRKGKSASTIICILKMLSLRTMNLVQKVRRKSLREFPICCTGSILQRFRVASIAIRKLTRAMECVTSAERMEITPYVIVMSVADRFFIYFKNFI